MSSLERLSAEAVAPSMERPSFVLAVSKLLRWRVIVFDVRIAKIEAQENLALSAVSN